MFWLPPVRFSTTTGCDHAAGSAWASVRASVSGEPPGGSGTMIRIGRSGKLCAAATSGTAKQTAVAHRTRTENGFVIAAGSLPRARACARMILLFARLWTRRLVDVAAEEVPG